MPRYPHFMTPLHGERYPSALVSVDCVGDVQRPMRRPAVETETLVSWHAVSGVSFGEEMHNARDFSGTHATDFWTKLYQLCRKRGTVMIICPCAPRVWPMLNLWKLLEEGQIVLRKNRDGGINQCVPGRFNNDGVMIVTEEPIHAIRIRFPDLPGTCLFVDARNYGTDLRVGSSGVHDIVSRGYMLLVGMVAALRHAELGSLQITAASQAMHSFRRAFLHDTLYIHDNKRAMDLEDAAFHGGRCEAFHIGDVAGELYHLDYSSLYAYCCTVEEVPTRLITVVPGGASLPRVGWKRQAVRLASVEIATGHNCFPYRGKQLTYYPTGRFNTTLAGPELALAERMKAVLTYHWTAWYDSGPALKGYADYLLAKRKECKREGMHDLETWVKRMLVCLPGKLGQRGKSWVDSPEVLSDYPYSSWQRVNRDGTRDRFRSIAWHVQREIQEQWGQEACPAIAAWISSAGRVRLWDSMLIAGLENVYYVDTDSIICNSDGFNRLRSHGRIGQGEPGLLRILWQGDGCEIRGWKDYTCGEDTRRAGMPRGQEGHDQFRGHVWIRPGMDESLHSHVTPVSKRVLMHYRNDRQYKHGRVQSDGIVTPFRLPHDRDCCK